MGWDKRKLINGVGWGVACCLPLLPIMVGVLFLLFIDSSLEEGFVVIPLAIGVSVVLLPICIYIPPGAYAFYRGRNAMLSGEQEKAITLLGQTIRARDNYYPAIAMYANLMVGKKEFEKALADLDRVIAAKKNYMQAYATRALAKDALGEYTRGDISAANIG